MIGPVAGVSLEHLLFKTKTGVNWFYFYPVSKGSGYKNIYSSDFLLSVYARFQLTAYLDFVSTFGTNYQNFKINTSSTEFNADTLEQTSINYIFNFSLSTKF
ncbi:MAG: hypothetical protein B7Y39_11790 [Bdellovibrio sp. 28-41-41]|nr:MAG: hypothetical protein B7Y39_11790 [Bdellovibrio sp. 28-41-41]